MYLKKSIEIDGKEVSFETGKMAKQADGAVVIQMGGTLVLVTAVSAHEAKADMGFFPLTVEYREKYYAAGRFPGGFFKREARPSEKEILAARLIDRPIRPLFPDHYRNETQIIANIFSMDLENEPDVLAAIGSSVSLGLSDIPFAGVIATVRVARVDGKFVIFPTVEQTEQGDLELIVAGSADSIMMVEGESNEVAEEDLLKAIDAAHEAIKKLVAFQIEFFKEAGAAEKREVELPLIPEGLLEDVEKQSRQGIKDAVRIREKKERRTALKTITDDALLALDEKYPECAGFIKNMVHDIEKNEVRSMIVDESVRLDGRSPGEIRPISCEIGLLPRAHGSALFTRGQTQSLGVITLGSGSDEQIIDTVSEEYKKKYMLHYNFPPFCTGEAKPIRGTSRREIGHGNLAERAIRPVLPKHEDFPYTIRIVSEVLESNGSSSMATVCSGSMALMDAGVPVKSPVAGIAMGLIKEGDKVAVLSDILGDEDHLGDMDFKVTGTEKGVTAVQMDIKIDGISRQIMEDALAQANKGRAHIMGEMAKAIDISRKDMSEYAPKIISFKIKSDKIGTVIGPGGKTIRGITEETGVKIDIDEDGTVRISSPDSAAATKARDIVDGLTAEPEVGKAYRGKVKRVRDFGAFVEFLPGKDGMVHISELDINRTANVTDVCKEGDMLDVLVKHVAPDGKVALSRKMYLQMKQKEETTE